MKRKPLKTRLFLMTGLMILAILLSGFGNVAGAESKTSATLATAGEPLKFYALSPQGCNGDDNLVLSNVYDCLTFLNADGSISPALAESWEISSDGLVYTFHLRKGVKFHDGSEMTAEDVKFTLDKGAAGPLGNALLVNYDHVNIIDDYTVELHLKAPYAAFLYCIASRVAGISSKAHFDAVGDEGYLKAPIGTGPYKFVSAVAGDTITLEAFDGHWRGKAPIDTIYIRTMTDKTTQIISLENGDIDAVRNPSIDACIKLDASLGVTWTRMDSAFHVALYLAEWGGSPAEDLNFRKAVQSAVNKNDVNEGVNEGYAAILEIDIPANYGGYPVGFKTVPYDLEQAKQYLAASNYDGKEFSILTKVGSAYETAAIIIQAQLIELGINCTVNAVDNATYSSLWESGNFGSIIVIGASSMMDSDGLMPIFSPPEAGWTYSQNAQYGRTREIYAILQEGRATQGDARRDIYRKAVDIITDEAYTVPLYTEIQTVAYNDGLEGVTGHCLGTYNFYNWKWK